MKGSTNRQTTTRISGSLKLSSSTYVVKQTSFIPKIDGKSKGEEESNGAIIGGAVGASAAVILLCAIIAFFILLRRKKCR